MRESRLVVTIRAHWVNRWLLSWAARPFVQVDGVDHPCRWAHPRRLSLSPGRHVVAVYLRYKGTSAALGTGRLTVHTQPGTTVEIAARTSWLNQVPLKPVVEPAAAGDDGTQPAGTLGRDEAAAPRDGRLS